jgi:Type-IV b secretion system, inner-membrane complex component
MKHNSILAAILTLTSTMSFADSSAVTPPQSSSSPTTTTVPTPTTTNAPTPTTTNAPTPTTTTLPTPTTTNAPSNPPGTSDTPANNNQQTPQTTTLPTPQGNANTPANGSQPSSNIEPAESAQKNQKIDCNLKLSDDEKDIKQDLIKKWAQSAAIQAFTMNATDLDSQMKELEQCFTKSGWNGFQSALEKSGNLKTIQEEKLSVQASIAGELTVQTPKSNEWSVVIPVDVTYKNAKDSIQQKLNIQMLIEKQKDGALGILQVVAAPQTPKTMPAPSENTDNSANSNNSGSPEANNTTE